MAAVLQSMPEVVNDWLAYSEDKRASLGWGFGPSYAGNWTLDGPDEVRESFDSLYAGCAAFILRELDFWVAIEDNA